MARVISRLACRLDTLPAAIHASKHGSQVDAFIQLVPIDVEAKHLVILSLRVVGALQARVKLQGQANYTTIGQGYSRILLGERYLFRRAAYRVHQRRHIHSMSSHL